MRKPQKPLSILLALSLILAFMPQAALAAVGDTFQDGNGVQYKVLTEAPGGTVAVSTGHNIAGTTLTIPATVTNPNNGLVYGVARIEPQAFMGNTQITEVSLPGGLANIGNEASFGCTALRLLRLGGIPLVMGTSVFQSVPATALALVPNNSILSLGEFRGQWDPHPVAGYLPQPMPMRGTVGDHFIVGTAVETRNIASASFIWKKGGAVVPGQTTSTLNLIANTAADAGTYTLYLVHELVEYELAQVEIFLYAITTDSLPNGTVGVPYSQTLAATWTAPIKWTLDGGALPDGLTLSQSGVISGVPTVAGVFNFDVKATHDSGSVTETLSITIGSAQQSYVMVSDSGRDSTPGTAITGLPNSHTLYTGGRVSWTPFPTGGTWNYDGGYLFMTRDGDNVTFTALKTGKTEVTYTVNGVSHTVSITICESILPKTGDNGDITPWLTFMLAALCGAGAILLIRKKKEHADKA